MDEPSQISFDEAQSLAFQMIRTQLPEAILLNLYFWGSRWFETDGPDSDWDFLASNPNF